MARAHANPVWDLTRRIEASAGLKFQRRFRHLLISLQAFRVNYQHLQKALQHFKRPEMAIQLFDADTDYGRLTSYLVEVARLLHNYTAAAKSLVEHTRVLVKELHSAKAFTGEYQAEVTRTFDAPFPHFIQDLRNYTLHVALPFTTATAKWKAGEDLRTAILLDVKHLRLWNGWTAKSRSYLSTLQDEADLEDMVTAYYDLVSGFHLWFAKRQVELHRRQLQHLQSLQRSLKRYTDASPPAGDA